MVFTLAPKILNSFDMPKSPTPGSKGRMGRNHFYLLTQIFLFHFLRSDSYFILHNHAMLMMIHMFKMIGSSNLGKNCYAVITVIEKLQPIIFWA